MKKSNEYKVAHITSMDDLKKEISQMKMRVKAHEIALEERFKNIPKETLKAATVAVVPAFLLKKTGIPAGGILKSATKILFSKNKKQDFKTELAAGIKSVGVVTAIKSITSFIKNRKRKKLLEKQKFNSGKI